MRRWIAIAIFVLDLIARPLSADTSVPEGLSPDERIAYLTLADFLKEGFKYAAPAPAVMIACISTSSDGEQRFAVDPTTNFMSAVTANLSKKVPNLELHTASDCIDTGPGVRVRATNAPAVFLYTYPLDHLDIDLLKGIGCDAGYFAGWHRMPLYGGGFNYRMVAGVPSAKAERACEMAE